MSTSLVDLPDELIELVVKNRLDIRDLVALLCTCKRFRVVHAIIPNILNYLYLDKLNDENNDECVSNVYRDNENIPPAWRSSIVYITEPCNEIKKYTLHKLMVCNNASDAIIPQYATHYYASCTRVSSIHINMVELLCGSCKLSGCIIDRLILCPHSYMSEISNCSIKSLVIYSNNLIINNSFAALQNLECTYIMYRTMRDYLPNLCSLTMHTYNSDILKRHSNHKVQKLSMIYDEGVFSLPDSYNCQELNLVICKPAKIEMNIPQSIRKLTVNGHSMAQMLSIVDTLRMRCPPIVELAIYNISTADINGLAIEKLTMIYTTPLLRVAELYLPNLKWLRTDMALPLLCAINAPDLSYLSIVSQDPPNILLPRISAAFPKLHTVAIWLGEYIYDDHSWTEPSYTIVNDYTDVKKENLSFILHVYNIKSNDVIYKPLTYPVSEYYRQYIIL